MTRSSKRSARTLAAPFLITVAMAPACAPQQATSEPAAPWPTTTAVSPVPAPTSNDVLEPTAAPPRPPPPPVNEADLSDPTDLSRLQRRADGTCWQMFPPCQPVMVCNPPPPKQVRCPK